MSLAVPFATCYLPAMFFNRGRELDGPGVTLTKATQGGTSIQSGAILLGNLQDLGKSRCWAGLRSHREGKGSEEGTKNRKGIPPFCVLGLSTEAPAFKHTLTVQHHVSFELGVQSNVACGWR